MCIPGQLFGSVWAIFTLSVLAYLLCVHLLFVYLKTAHHSVWLELGSPSLILNNSLMNNWKFLKFLLRRDYKLLRDRTLENRAGRTLTLFLINCGLFSLLLLLFEFSHFCQST
jgi:hypothetical protein